EEDQGVEDESERADLVLHAVLVALVELTGALGLVLNALVLFNTRYMDAAVTQLRADGFDVRDEDVARLSPFVRHHVNMLGRYSFQLPDLPGGLRPLRGKNAASDEE
ncbi:Tn3 family transposase, partial [Actinomadura kijaniata]|uniref:Tn3 family transposase n=1 Tax=Actinomadura kijaniata TaxID=46161 RepID=UPI0031DF93C4